HVRQGLHIVKTSRGKIGEVVPDEINRRLLCDIRMERSFFKVGHLLGEQAIFVFQVLVLLEAIFRDLE
ncbi:MAG: hypothetical protein Q9228_003918, partial [Teloschistes exilis]